MSLRSNNTIKTNSKHPRAIIHKQILDVAENEPTASITEIAAQVSGASIGLVERVLEEYGDPSPVDATEDHSATGDDKHANSEHTTANEVRGSPFYTETVSSLTTKQLRTLREIYKNPTATQSDLANIFEVDRTSISHRLNNIEKFNWQRRTEFVKALFGNDPGTATSTNDSPTPGSDSATQITDTGSDKCSPAIGPDLQSMDQLDECCTVNLDLSLAHKVLQVCFRSEDISDDEELRLLRGFIMSPTPEQ